MNDPQTTAARELENKLKEIGPSEAITRLLAKYGPIQTKWGYTSELLAYFRWLKSVGITMTPDALIQDNLVCIYESKAVDIAMLLIG